MTDQHPITPPPELALQWINEYLNEHPEGVDVEVLVVSAAQWGADQELEACVKLLELSDKNARDFLYSARRPKPPSLKEQALEMLENAWEGGHINNKAAQTIRRALEQLDD
jgi:lysophospholipase L1-like esterase